MVIYNSSPCDELPKADQYMAASLSFLGGGWGRRPIWLGKMVSSVLFSRVKRRIILVECNLIVNFYHVLEAVIRLRSRTIFNFIIPLSILHTMSIFFRK